MERASYDLKLDRAEKHLIDLEAEIDRYIDSHPYQLDERPEYKKKTRGWYLRFTSQPDDSIALIAGDFLYNVRAAYDHLVTACVPNKHRRDVNFPVFFHGVWEPAQDGDDAQRRDMRARWTTYTAHMPDVVVTLLKSCQPPDRALDETAWAMHSFVMLNRLRNTDAHRKLTVVSSMLLAPLSTWRTPDGSIHFSGASDLGPMDGIGDGAKIHGIPQHAVDVEIHGTPHVVIRLGEFDGGFQMNEGFRSEILGVARQNMDVFRRVAGLPPEVPRSS